MHFLFFKDVLDGVLTLISEKNPELKFIKLMSGYKRFDPTRGMEYILDLLLSHPTRGETTYRQDIDVY